MTIKRNVTKTVSLLLMLAVFCSVIFAMGITANAASDTIYVNNIAMKDGQYLKENATAVTTTKPGSDYAYYKGGVLYLYNFDLKWDGSASVTGAINAGDSDLSISLNGTNTITSSVGQAVVANNKMLTIRGSGSLIVNSTAGCAINCGGLVVEGGTLNVKGIYGILAGYGDTVISNGKIEVTCTDYGITCKNITVYAGGTMDVVGLREALMLGGRLTAANGLLVRGARRAYGPIAAYDRSSIYERVYVGDHECFGDTATCQTPMKCSNCGKVFDVYADHIWSTIWDANTKDGHAHKCTTKGCTATSTPEAHTPGAPATEFNDQTCTTCGYIITPKLNHTHSIRKFSAVAATCEKNGNLEYYVCSGCSKLFRDAAATKEYADASSVIIPPTGHRFAEDWSMDASGHWHTCADCGAKEGKVNHTPGAEATLTTDQICTVCGYVIKKAEPHTHAFGDHWFSDDTAHWHACACGEVREKAVHADADGDHLCDSCHWAMESDAQEATDATAPEDDQEATEGSDTKPNKEPGERPDGDDEQGGIVPVVIVVCILGVLFLATGTVLIVILVKQKKLR